MKAGQASKTAELVCVARAIAHGVIAPERFADPTALQLLPEPQRQQVERARQGDASQNFRQRMHMMVVRTVAIDDAVRAAASPQLVILGAGLDGRAWRMAELAKVSVFEVDHPDSQRDKRERAAKLRPASADIRFVPVDFERDELEAALAAAGHDAAQPTTWIWEGVVMYLTLADIEATLRVVQRRSAPGSTIVIAYHQPSWVLSLLGFYLQRLGEPLRSAFRPEQMRALLARFGFAIKSDLNTQQLAQALSPGIEEVARRVRHMRIVVATSG